MLTDKMQFGFRDVIEMPAVLAFQAHAYLDVLDRIHKPKEK